MDPFLDEIRIFGGNFAPQGWACCNGKLLAISTNTALFSLLGTTYGGDGVQTFALPNLQGRVPMHWGQGQGLSPYSIGQNGGAENVTLNQSQMPAHSHMAGVINGAKGGPADQQSLEQIIELAKPAHTVAQFQWAEPRLRIGLQGLVGVDTVIGKYPVGVIEGQGKLGYDTVLGNPDEEARTASMKIEQRSILGANSVLM